MLRRREVFSPEHVATALYRGILQRDPDSAGFRDNVKLLRSGRARTSNSQLHRIARVPLARPRRLVPVTPLRAGVSPRYRRNVNSGKPVAIVRELN
jgi:hypothetical protein